MAALRKAATYAVGTEEGWDAFDLEKLGGEVLPFFSSQENRACGMATAGERRRLRSYISSRGGLRKTESSAEYVTAMSVETAAIQAAADEAVSRRYNTVSLRARDFDT